MSAFGRSGLLAAVILGCGVLVARAQVETEYAKAVTTIYAVAKIGGFVKDWCDLRAPQTKAVTALGLANWRKTFKLEEVEKRFKGLVGDKIAQIDASLEPNRQPTYAGLDGASRDPAADCLGIEAYLNAEVNPQKRYPTAYRLALSQPPITSSAAAPAAPAPTVTASTAARGNVYTVAQLGVILEKARAAKQPEESALRALGQFFVTGSLERYDRDASVFLNTLRDGFRSRVSVTCYDGNLWKLYEAGTRNVTLRANFRQMTGSSIVQLTDCAVVSNAAGLQPVKLEDRSALQRIQVTPQRVMTKPNAGLKAAQMDGLYWNAQGKWTYSGYQFVEDTYLLLKDGWLYKNLRFAPADLNVAESKKLEPQHWAQFKRQGKQILVQWRDDWGVATGKPQVLDAELKAPMKRGATLNGVFQASNSYTLGTSSDGASSSSISSYAFAPNGTYTYSSLRTTTASSRVGTGVSGQVGGTSFGSGGTFSSGVGGSDDAGTYSFDGYTLELRSKSGAVTRAFAFLWDDAKYSGSLVINGTTYSIPQKK